MNALSNCLFALCCCAAVCFGRNRDTAFIVRPDLQKAVLGFEITPEEDQEFCDYIIKKLSDAFGSYLIATDRTKLETITGLARPILCYLITDAHEVNAAQGMRNGQVSSVLYKFESGDTNAAAAGYATPNSVGMAGWGRNKPFESGLRENLNTLTHAIRYTKTPAQANVRLDSLMRDERFVERDKKAYFVQPEFSEATFGYAPSEDEIHDFTRIISSHLGKVLNADCRIVSKKEAEGIRDLGSLLAHVIFSVPGRKVAFSLERKGARIIDKVYENLDVKDWNENHIFLQGLDNLFKLMDKDIKSSDLQAETPAAQK